MSEFEDQLKQIAAGQEWELSALGESRTSLEYLRDCLGMVGLASSGAASGESYAGADATGTGGL